MLLQYLTKEHNSAPSTQPILDLVVKTLALLSKTSLTLNLKVPDPWRSWRLHPFARRSRS